MNSNRPQLSTEARIIPVWAIVLAVAVFGSIVVLLNSLLTREPNPPPLAFRIPFGVLIGALMAFFVLLIGYVNVDAGRRGMSRLLWTLLVIFVPNGIGFVIYFVFRQPRQTACARCGTTISPGFNYCPACSFPVHPACPKCRCAVREYDVFCPYCGASLSALNQPHL